MNFYKRLVQLGSILTLLLLSVTTVLVVQTAHAEEAAEALVTEPLPSNLPDRLQNLKMDVINLNRDLFILEEELLFPASTQVAVFLSMDVGEFFQLDAVHLTIDDQEVTDYLYTEQQIDALFRGGVQRLYVGNIRSGEHEISAFFTGRGPKGRDYRRAVSHKFVKSTDIKQLELQIRDSMTFHQPELTVKEWR